MLESASTIANDLAAGGLFDRLQLVFTRMPEEDREVILRVLTDQEPPSTMDRDELVVANYRGFRVLRYVLGPLHDLWLETIRDAVVLLEPEERAAARQILIEGLAAVDQVDGPRPR
jgi:hypothetical protein